jgi:hypothetical protein
MPILKKTKDSFIKLIFGKTIVPRGLFELNQYFRIYEPIEFKYEKHNESIVAISTNFRYGSIVTSGRNKEELDKNIKDAILTSFEIPSSYAEEAKIYKVGEEEKAYALA